MSDKPFRVLLVTNNYPYEGHPNVGTFVAALARKWAEQGDSVQVLAPLPVWTPRTGEFVWRHAPSSGPGEPDVMYPSFLSYSNQKIGPFSTARWTARSFSRSVRLASEKIAAPDVVYSHFLHPAGVAGQMVARRLGRPSVVALGESGFGAAEDVYGRERIRELVKDFDGILSVSEENAEIMVERYGAARACIEVIPNAVDTDRFRPQDRAEARRRLGLPEDATILSFTGYFIDRKGPLRVLEAMEQVPNLYGVFLGDGPEVPSGERVLHAGRVGHEDVVRWLCASDFFVLPTLAEGSPNAVLEAMACGLPVVSSDIPSLRETVSEESSILVDPMSIPALTDALRRLATQPELRARMAAAALEHGSRTNLDARAARIRAWLQRIAAEHASPPR